MNLSEHFVWWNDIAGTLKPDLENLKYTDLTILIKGGNPLDLLQKLLNDWRTHTYVHTYICSHIT